MINPHNKTRMLILAEAMWFYATEWNVEHYLYAVKHKMLMNQLSLLEIVQENYAFAVIPYFFILQRHYMPANCKVGKLPVPNEYRSSNVLFLDI